MKELFFQNFIALLVGYLKIYQSASQCISVNKDIILISISFGKAQKF